MPVGDTSSVNRTLVQSCALQLHNYSFWLLAFAISHLYVHFKAAKISAILYAVVHTASHIRANLQNQK